MTAGRIKAAIAGFISLCGAGHALAAPDFPRIAIFALSEDGSRQIIDAPIGAIPPPAAPTTYTVTGSVIYMRQTGLFYAVEYSAQCTLVDDGTYTTPTPPKYGTWTSAVMNETLSAGPCAGVSLPANVFSETWTKNLVAKTDSFVANWQTSDGLFNVDFDVTLTDTPRITMSSKDITGMTAKVAAGQNIALSIPAYTSILQTQSWTIPGKTVGGYAPSSTACNASVPCPAPSNLTLFPSNFFWIDSATGRQLDYNWTLTDGTAGSVDAKFTIEKPAGSGATAATNPTAIINQGGTLMLSFGNFPAVAGITFTNTDSQPPDFSGTFEWVQLISTYTVTLTPITGKVLTCTVKPGLDTSYPYATGITTNDSPSVPLKNTYQTVAVSTAFKMYLFWNSGTTGSIPISLGYLPWQWSATAAQNVGAGTWSITAASGGPTAAFAASDSYPTWDSVFASGSAIKCK